MITGQSISTLSPTAGLFWNGLAAREIRFQACIDCGVARHPPSSRCESCGSQSWAVRTSSGRGTVFSWGIPRRPRMPSPPAATDRIVVLVELDEGIRMLGHFDGSRPHPKIGDRVTAVIATYGDYPIVIFRDDARA